MADARQLVSKLMAYRDVLRDDGVGVIEYTEQLTYLLFLKMAHERANRPLRPERIVPEAYDWTRLVDATGEELERLYSWMLENLGKQPGVVGVIFRKAQNRIQDPAKLRRLVSDLIDKEHWSSSGTDLTGDAYEEILASGAT
ncbi:MAG: type I restriction-modification system subunit M N-terminal domain-containing protein, partial [Propionibacteriaceae bacterium]|nr:type I restriction-modification system subunit M N-terminal domain-containing protein [Propionibacteriaceae bacterium]